MKNILMIANFSRLPWENANSRFTYILEAINKEKYNIELITSDFSHREKKKRLDKSKEFTKYKITLINEPGYKKNVSLKRFYSHYILALNIKKYLEKIEKPDIIYCAIPSLSVGKVIAKYAEKNNIRFIIDIQDLWPEAFRMVFNLPIISDLIFYPMKKEADFIYSRADDIIAVSETYLNRAKLVNKKYENQLIVFLGTDLEKFDDARNRNKIVLNDNNIRIGYVGTLGHSYDIKSIIDAIKILKDKEVQDIILVVMGDGPLRNVFEMYAKEKNIQCQFTGMLDYEKMIGTLCSCDIAVNPISKGAAQSIINKVGDYAAAALPVINTQECIEYQKLVKEYYIGYNCENGNSEDIAKKIMCLIKDNELRKKMGTNNRKLAEEKFDRASNYKKIIQLIERG